MKVANKQYSREELLRRSGDLSSLFGARRMTFTDGCANGMRFIEVKTAAGLRMLISEDRCLDIMELSYKGNNVGLMTVNGFNSNVYAKPTCDFDEFKRYWVGGMLTTCGLRNTGTSCEHDGEAFPVHDRIGLTPAVNVGVTVDDENNILISGSVIECALGYSLEIKRLITIPGDSGKIIVKDKICNNGFRNEALFLLYHINFGFPFMREGVELSFPRGEVQPRDEYSAQFMDSYRQVEAPSDNGQDQYFFHMAEDKAAVFSLTNHDLRVKATVTYDTDALPVLVEWKGMGSGNYALGVELSTSTVCGRKEELEKGYKTCIKAFDSVEYGFELELSDI